MRAVLIGMFAASAMLLTANVQADAALAKESGCMNCHQVDTKLVGPALQDIAAKYADRDDAVEYMTDKIKNGSVDVWGPVPMPPNAMVSEENAEKLAEFILTLN